MALASTQTGVLSRLRRLTDGCYMVSATLVVATLLMFHAGDTAALQRGWQALASAGATPGGRGDAVCSSVPTKWAVTHDQHEQTVDAKKPLGCLNKYKYTIYQQIKATQ